MTFGTHLVYVGMHFICVCVYVCVYACICKLSDVHRDFSDFCFLCFDITKPCGKTSGVSLELTASTASKTEKPKPE